MWDYQPRARELVGLYHRLSVLFKRIFPAKDVRRAVVRHGRAGEDEQILPRHTKVTDAEPYEVEKMLTVGAAFGADSFQPEFVVVAIFQVKLQDDGSAAKDGAAQAKVHSPA